MLEGMVHWPAEFASRYRTEGYWAGTTLGGAFDRAVATYSHREAVVGEDKRLTYRELGQRVNRFALYLARRRITSGERVVSQLPNVWEFIAEPVNEMRHGPFRN